MQVCRAGVFRQRPFCAPIGMAQRYPTPLFSRMNLHSYTYGYEPPKTPRFFKCRVVRALLHRTCIPTPAPQGSMTTHMPAERRLCVILIPRSPSTGITRLSAHPSASGDLGKPGALAASPAAAASSCHSEV